jgi:hypothetical protein
MPFANDMDRSQKILYLRLLQMIVAAATMIAVTREAHFTRWI